MKRLLACLGMLTAATLLPSGITHAQTRNFITSDAGAYWWVDAGAAIPQDGHLTEFGIWNSGQKVSYDVGCALDLGLGYAFNKYVSTELQWGGTWNEIHSVEGASLNDTSFGTMPILANLILQYPIPQTRVVPYVGGGVGGAATFFDTDGFYAHVPGGAVEIHGSDSDFVFAWQGLAGVRVDLNRQASLGLGYRFLYADASSFSYDSWYHGAPNLNVKFSSFESHIVSLTFRMKF